MTIMATRSRHCATKTCKATEMYIKINKCVPMANIKCGRKNVCLACLNLRFHNFNRLPTRNVTMLRNQVCNACTKQRTRQVVANVRYLNFSY